MIARSSGLLIWFLAILSTLQADPPKVDPANVTLKPGVNRVVTIKLDKDKKLGMQKLFSNGQLTFVRLYSDDPSEYNYLVSAGTDDNGDFVTGKFGLVVWTVGEASGTTVIITIVAPTPPVPPTPPTPPVPPAPPVPTELMSKLSAAVTADMDKSNTSKLAEVYKNGVPDSSNTVGEVFSSFFSHSVMLGVPRVPQLSNVRHVIDWYIGSVDPNATLDATTRAMFDSKFKTLSAALYAVSR